MKWKEGVHFWDERSKVKLNGKNLHDSIVKVRFISILFGLFSLNYVAYFGLSPSHPRCKFSLFSISLIFRTPIKVSFSFL